MGDIYFSFDFSTQLGYLLTTTYGVDVTSNSYGSSDLDNDGFDAASQEADFWHAGTATTPLFSTGRRRTGLRHGTAPGAARWDPGRRLRRSLAARLGLDREDLAVVDNDVIEWSNRGPGATGRAGTDVVADGS
jgi:hypothetical protein